MSRESLSRVFWDAYRYHHPDGTIVDLEQMPEEDQAAIEGGAHAVAAHVASPAAADHDSAAEITRLRQLLARVRADLGWIWRETADENARQRADQALTALKEAGIE